MSVNTRALRILHFASHTINVGDGALNSVIQERLRSLAQRPIEFTLADSVVSPPELCPSDVDAFDLVVVGGGGAISNGPRTTRNGTELSMSLDDYRRCRTPFAFVALGHNTFNGVTYRNGPALAQLICTAAERGDPFSVRNDGSLARLRRDIGAVTDTVVEVPDPGFFVASPATRPQEVSDRPYMLLQVAADGLGLRLGASKARRALWRIWPLGALALADELAAFALGIWRKHGMDILVTPHIPPDVPLAKLVIEKLYRAAGAAAVYRPFRLGGTPHPLHAHRFFSAYAAADLVVGMRGHAVICGVGLRRPVVALSTHPKITPFMENCGLGEWSVEPSHDLAGELAKRCDMLLSGGTEKYFADRDSAVAGFSQRLDEFLSKALEKITP